jgi:Lon protease-like protein
MGWFDFVRSPTGPTVNTLNIPIFPLNTVFFPVQVLPLKIFEQRYLDMAATCLKENSPFGICLIANGGETGACRRTAHGRHAWPTIGNWEMEQLGILMITAKGAGRFRIMEAKTGPGNLLQASVEILAEAMPIALPSERKRLLPLLERVVRDLGNERIPEPHQYDDADWVGYRITEVLPINNLAKQKLLELEDPLVRLEILEKFLDQRNLLG